MRISKKDLFGYLFLVVSTLAVLTAASALQCATEISSQYYEIRSAKITEPLRIVQLSDLHSHVFGRDNDVLAELVTAQQPDLVVMTGDMMDKQDENADVVCSLIRQLQDAAPVYCCYGNHEKDWMKRNSADLTAQLEAAGAVVLDLEFADITVKEQKLRLGGFHGYYRYWGMLPRDGGEEEFAEAFEDTDCYRILLNHIPTAWIDWGRIHSFPVELVFTGHYHGGQIRIPLIGSVYAPYIGFFPEYTEGIFVGDTATAVLSTGLGSSPGIPRINNLPQIVVVDLIPEA